MSLRCVALTAVLALAASYQPAVAARGARSPRARMASAAAAGDATLEERYAAIASAQPAQQRAYEAWVASGGLVAEEQVSRGAELGIAVDVPGGQISYADDFEQKRVRLNFDLIYCRHGKTTGNTEPRVYQG